MQHFHLKTLPMCLANNVPIFCYVSHIVSFCTSTSTFIWLFSAL
ncbi:hypothetical protein SPONN_2669 [uncultured Candidatus Thioglobus sp.]|nr:hypothetical protein SPONN_2669 [uncultured Candidatus Thioglobus sp.]